MPKIQDSKFEHCKVLKYTKEEMQKGLEDYVRIEQITKCSSVKSIPPKNRN